MAQGRSFKIISMIKWIRTSRLSIKNSLSTVPPSLFHETGFYSLGTQVTGLLFGGRGPCKTTSMLGYSCSDQPVLPPCCTARIFTVSDSYFYCPSLPGAQVTDLVLRGGGAIGAHVSGNPLSIEFGTNKTVEA